MLTVIIVNYKTDDLLIQFVKRECSKIRLPHKIVIVNNSATPESLDRISHGLNGVVVDTVEDEVKDANVYVINSQENLGFAKGNNLGVSFAMKHFNSDYFLFTNTDIRIVDADICEQLIRVLESKYDIGIIGPKVIGLKGEQQSPNRKFDLWYNHVWYYFIARFMTKDKLRSMDYAVTAKEGYHYQVMGSFFMVPSQTFIDAGMFDTSTFLYYEESILTEKMLLIGKKVYYYPKVTVIHEHGTTTKKYLDYLKIDKMKYESASYYFSKYRGKNKFELRLVWYIHSAIIRIIHLFKK